MKPSLRRLRRLGGREEIRLERVIRARDRRKRRTQAPAPSPCHGHSMEPEPAPSPQLLLPPPCVAIAEPVGFDVVIYVGADGRFYGLAVLAAGTFRAPPVKKWAEVVCFGLSFEVAACQLSAVAQRLE